MIKKISLLILLISIITTTSNANQADAITGKYHLPNKIDILIFKFKSKYFGKIIALNGFSNGKTKDVNNPDESKQNDPLIGKVIIKNLEYDPKKKQWINGTIYASEKGITLDFKIIANTKNDIEVEASKLVFWKTMKWKKIK